MADSTTSIAPSPGNRESLLKAIEQAIASIRFGTVPLIIQDGRVIQIDKTEKIRLT